MMTTHAQSFARIWWQRATVLDRVTLGYIALFGAGVAWFGRGHTSWPNLFLIHLALVVTIPVVIWFWHDRYTGIPGFVRQLYPPFLYPFFYSETEVAMRWLLDSFQDIHLVAFEKGIFGVDFNVWLLKLQIPVVNEWMMFAYFCYYLLVPLLGFTLYFKRRIPELQAFLAASTITFIISYIGFVLYPVEGPRFFLAEHFSAPLRGYFFVPLVQWIIANGAVHGGCMPSSHVAVAWVVLIWSYRTYRNLARLLTPIVATLFVATVWGRFHYISDVAVGWLVGFAGLWLADRMVARWRRKSLGGTP